MQATTPQGKGNVMRHHIATKLAAATLTLLTGSAAACCPDIGHILGSASTGLGSSYPQARDLSQLSTARVYVFQREGISYLQINDLTGQARTAIGWVENTRWVLPIGADADRTVILPVGSPTPADTLLVYEADDVTVRLQNTSGGNTWLIVSKK
ncbi:hypothetical protein [Xanthomonas phaseoli]|nr:hypothetical protein [Xanthomonas phaseoli]